jgi:GT2 family glycosyltransferase
LKIGVAISSYKNNDEVIQLIRRIISESWPVEGIIVVDSMGDDIFKKYLQNDGLDIVEYYNFGVNLGSAGNLSKRLELSAKKNWDFVLALNHDALVTKSTLENLLKYDNTPNLGALYPLKFFAKKNFYDYSGSREVGPWRAFGRKNPTPNQLIPCLWSSSNGALYNLKPIREGITPNGDLWMGWEDYLYGLDLRKSGYKQFLVTNATCEDNYEFIEKKIGFKNFIVADKPSWYNYYNTRNLLLISIYFHPSFLRVARIILRYILEILLLIFSSSENNKKKDISLKFKGFYDGIIKITGKREL